MKCPSPLSAKQAFGERARCSWTSRHRPARASRHPWRNFESYRRRAALERKRSTGRQPARATIKTLANSRARDDHHGAHGCRFSSRLPRRSQPDCCAIECRQCLQRFPRHPTKSRQHQRSPSCSTWSVRSIARPSQPSAHAASGEVGLHAAGSRLVL
jgi:hypothetical protein